MKRQADATAQDACASFAAVVSSTVGEPAAISDTAPYSRYASSHARTHFLDTIPTSPRFDVMAAVTRFLAVDSPTGAPSAGLASWSRRRTQSRTDIRWKSPSRLTVL
jgi:hypothetical protein